MAIITDIEINTGEIKSLYLRVNNVDVNNHNANSIALIRGFISEEAFRSGKHFAYEEVIEFNADVSVPLWEQAYLSLKDKYPEFEDC